MINLDDDYYTPKNATQASVFVGKCYEYLISNNKPDCWRKELKFHLFLSDIVRYGINRLRFRRSVVREIIDEAITAGEIFKIVIDEEVFGARFINIPLPALILGEGVEGALRLMKWCNGT